MSDVLFKQVTEMVTNLSRIEKVKLIERLSTMLESELVEEEPKKPRRSLLGIWADLGPAPSAEDIDEARREMWGNFPREDI